MTDETPPTAAPAPAPVPSPLAEANPRSLDDLMSGDPFLFTRKNRDEIVAELRRMRAVRARAEAEGSAKGGKKGGAKAPAVVAAGDLGI